MKILITLFVLILSPACWTFDAQSKCNEFISQEKNYKKAHLDKNCQIAALNGHPQAQYSVGMGYGFEGLHDLEEEYYRLAANSKLIDAYLALGHALSNKEPWEAIYWYQRYYNTKTEGYGYAAYRLTDVFQKLGDEIQANYWRSLCQESPYQGCQ